MAGKKETDTNNSKSQVVVLRKMSEGVNSALEARPFQINELAVLTGNDEKEIQRSLYILEGHKYVSPTPPGDFTSKIWHITDFGLLAIRNMSSSPRLFI